MKAVIFIMIGLGIAILSQAKTLKDFHIEPDFVKDGEYMKIKIKESIILDFDKIDGEKFFGISDIAYDEKKHLLYAINDRGVMFTFSLFVEDGQIKQIKSLHAIPLKDKRGKRLKGYYRDSEGLSMVGDSLAISFERRPRVSLFDKEMRFKKMVKIPEKLKRIKSYQGKNDALEALTYSSKLGFITAAEYPLRGKRKGYHDIYAQKGKICEIKRDRYNAIVAMEMMADGDILLLQRKFLWKSLTMENTLSRVHISEPKEGICKVDILAWMSSKEGWNIDNFEGLTHISDNLYMMISDDNGNFFQKTILTLFEIKEKR
jgi:hypothetical protein